MRLLVASACLLLGCEGPPAVVEMGGVDLASAPAIDAATAPPDLAFQLYAVAWITLLLVLGCLSFARRDL